MTLFDDIWNWCKSKVQALINSAVSSIKTWTNNVISAAIAGIQKVYYDFRDYITNVSNYISEYVTNVYNTVNEYVSNVYNTVNDYVTNVYNTTKQYITNVTEVINKYTTYKTYETINYVTNVIGVLDPLGFLKDPTGYITGVWNLLIDPWAHGIVKSFWEGLEAGLDE